MIPRRGNTIRCDLFDLDRSVEEARRAHELRHIYQSGQAFGWDGQGVLAEASRGTAG